MPAISSVTNLLPPGLSRFAPPQSLPSPPFLESLFLEDPLPLVLALVLAALVAVGVGNQRARLIAGIATGAVLLGLAAGAYMTATVIETDRERISRGSVSLVGAVARGDARIASLYLADPVRTRALPADREWPRSELESLIARATDTGVTDVEVTAIQAHLDGPRVARTQIRVRGATPQGPTLPTWWMLNWQRPAEDPGGLPVNDVSGWVVVTIEPVSIPGVISAD